MSKPGFSMGFGKPAKGLGSRPVASKSAPKPVRKKAAFGDDSDSEPEPQMKRGARAEAITEFNDDAPPSLTISDESLRKKPKPKFGSITEPPMLKSKKRDPSILGDMSSSLTSRRHLEAAEATDEHIFDYDAIYDSLKPRKKVTEADEGGERKSRYMKNVVAAATVRNRDRLIAEEKKIAREREAEGDEFADKEKFVTEAYKRQQEENRRIEEEEKRKEEEEAKKNQMGGMRNFYKELLDKGEERHAQVMQAAEERIKEGPKGDVEEAKEKTEEDIAREINEKGGAIALNDEGQVVDKRELLRGGLNVVAKKPPPAQRGAGGQGPTFDSDRSQRSQGFVGRGGRAAMRERQSRMIEEQLAQQLKRSLDQEDEEKERVERAAKSRKTEAEISSAKERYLARKRAAEEAKRK